MAYTDSERREFFRLNYKTPIRFKSYEAKELQKTAKLVGPLDGTTRNISQNGVLFQTEENPPQLSSIVWMNLDMRTLKICQEIEAKALIFNNGVLGKVVRVEEDTNNNNTYDIGVCFLRKDQKDSSEVREALGQLNQK